MSIGRAGRKGGKVAHAHVLRGEVHDLLRRGGEFLQRGQLEEAWQCANAALARNMDSAGALYLLAQCAFDWDYPGLSANLFRRACALRPDVLGNWMGFGSALLDMRQFDAAEECFRKAIEINPKEPLNYANMGALMLNQGRPAEAVEWCNKSLELSDVAQVRGNRGFARLMLGQWEEGFADYARSMDPCASGSRGRIRRQYRIPEEPDWNGTPGETVVVQSEQGLGDEISFASMIPDLIAAVGPQGKVILDAHPKLEHIMRRSFPEADVYGTRKRNGLDWPHRYKIDSSIPMSSLGAIFRHRAEDFPRRPWLVPSPDLRQKWRTWLDELPGVKCGIAWTGGIFVTNRAGRSATLEDFSALMMPGATYISLEYREDETAVAEWNAAHPGQQIVRPPVNQDDYDDVIALLAELDHVVSVTTSIVHACGAIGRQCWCIVPAVLTSSQWRYGLDGDEMLWYPPGSVRMFRQRPDEDGLREVIRRVAKQWRGVMKLRDVA